MGKSTSFFVFIKVKEKRGLLITSGGAWNAFGAGTLARLNINYDIVYAIGTGSLLAPMVILNEWDYIKEEFSIVENSHMFDYNFFINIPINKNGTVRKLQLIYSILRGNNTISSSNKIRKSINEFFPENYFNELRNENKEVIVATQNFSESPPKTHFFSSLIEEYEEFKDWMWCSSNFPFFGSLIKKGWLDSQGNFHIGNWSGGAIINMDLLREIESKNFEELDVIMHRPRFNKKLEGHEINSVSEYTEAKIEGMKYDIEYVYFYNTIKILNSNGVRVRVFWLPRELSNNSLNYNPKEMINWWNEGYKTALDNNRVDVFEPTKQRY